MEQIKFPQYLSRPFQILWWEQDELILILMLFEAAWLYGGLFWVFFIVLPYMLNKGKKKYNRGFVQHFFYAAGLTELKGYPSYFEKEFSE